MSLLEPSQSSSRDLAQYLVDQRLAGRLVLLVIDEAQNLSPAALEELRMLSNLETEKTKLLQIVLVGQPGLRDQLATPELEQLRQRITVSYHLPPLDAEETGHYINHRLRRAAIGAPLEFHALPRTIVSRAQSRRSAVDQRDLRCRAGVRLRRGTPAIDEELVADVLGELESTGVLPRQESAVAQELVAARLAVSGPGHVEPVAAAGAAGRVLDARHWPPTATRAVDDGARTAALDQREQSVRQREHELEQQRRVLAEEYRLLRSQRESLRPAASSMTDIRRPVHSPGAHSMSFGAARSEGFWGRVRRVMLGGSQAIAEKN